MAGSRMSEDKNHPGVGVKASEFLSWLLPLLGVRFCAHWLISLNQFPQLESVRVKWYSHFWHFTVSSVWKSLKRDCRFFWREANSTVVTRVVAQTGEESAESGKSWVGRVRSWGEGAVGEGGLNGSSLPNVSLPVCFFLSGPSGPACQVTCWGRW